MSRHRNTGPTPTEAFMARVVTLSEQIGVTILEPDGEHCVKHGRLWCKFCFPGCSLPTRSSAGPVLRPLTTQQSSD